jgi:hypothetical protein
MITASDLGMLCLLGIVVEFGRNKIPIDIHEVLLLLTFLSDHISLGTCYQWKNCDEFLLKLSSYIPEASPIYLTLKRKLMSLESIDHFMDLMEMTQEFFSIPNDVDPNEIHCPYSFKRESIIGIYIRTILTKWELLQFGEISSLYELFCQFVIPAAETQSHSSSSSTSQGIVLSIQEMKCQEPRVFLSNAEIATNHSDLLPAVESIHAYFDSNGTTNPLRSKNDLIAQTKATIDNFSSGSPQQKSRYQQAMLTLANMWIRNGYYFYASTATEEGMKMAHQLGDHTSVTYALLLLHHIIHGQEKIDIPYGDLHSVSTSTGTAATESDPTTTTTTRESFESSEQQSTENILIRCIQKSNELKLKSLEIQAIQLLVRYRMKGPLRNSVAAVLGYRSTSHSIPRSINSCDLTPAMLWALLQSTLTDTPSHLFAKTSQTKPKKSTNLHSPPSLETNSSPGVALSWRERMELSCQSYLMSSDLWSRLYLPAMGLFTCYRAFRHCGVSISTNGFLQIILKYCNLIHEITDNGSICILYALSLSSSSSSSLAPAQQSVLTQIFQKLTISLNILNSLSNLNQITTLLTPEIKLKMQYLKYLIQIKQSIIQFFLEQLAGSQTTLADVNDCQEGHLKDAMRYCNLLVENLLNHSKYYNSNEYILSNIYYCYVLSFIDTQLALKRIEQVFFILQRSSASFATSSSSSSSSFDHHQNIQWLTELTLMKIVILHKEIYQNKHEEMLIQLKIEINECLKISQDEYLPVVCATLSMISLDPGAEAR